MRARSWSTAASASAASVCSVRTANCRREAISPRSNATRTASTEIPKTHPTRAVGCTAKAMTIDVETQTTGIHRSGHLRKAMNVRTSSSIRWVTWIVSSHPPRVGTTMPMSWAETTEIAHPSNGADHARAIGRAAKAATTGSTNTGIEWVIGSVGHATEYMTSATNRKNQLRRDEK